MNKYIRIMRIDHWIKQFFIIPGCVCALFLADIECDSDVLIRFATGFLAASLIASANYSINEWLDAEFDKFHPTKKTRIAVTEKMDGRIVWMLWGMLVLTGLGLGCMINMPFVVMEAALCVMGIVYNVKPLRTKDIAILDVLSESVNNAIRLLLGWFIISPNTLPPCSIVCGYWFGGGFPYGS